MNEKTFDSKFWKIFTIFSILIGIILFFPFLITQFSWVDYNFNSTGQIGDTIGGVLGPFIGIVAAGLTFMAFWVQFKANEQIRKDTAIERFENKFYEMLRLHKENVNEIDVGGTVQGRKAFVRFFYEFKFLFSTIKGVYNEGKEQKEIGKLVDDDFLIIAYNYLFYGNGENSSKFIDLEMKKYSRKLYRQINQNLSAKQKHYENRQDNVTKIKGVVLSCLEGTSTKTEKCEFFYYPFDGQVTKLAHYYRHLYQTVKFVVITDEKVISENQKRFYLKSLRAQLSNHEQIMLYYNSITGAGKDWVKNKFFTDWKMIKNIPFPALIGEGTHIYERLGVTTEDVKSKRMFEWGY